jgi:hypothetical protein
MNYCGLSQGPQHKVEMIGRYNQTERPATILKHLKEIEVKCDVVNEQVHKVLKFLGTFGIRKQTSKTLVVLYNLFKLSIMCANEIKH